MLKVGSICHSAYKISQTAPEQDISEQLCLNGVSLKRINNILRLQRSAEGCVGHIQYWKLQEYLGQQQLIGQIDWLSYWFPNTSNLVILDYNPLVVGEERVAWRGQVKLTKIILSLLPPVWFCLLCWTLYFESCSLRQHCPAELSVMTETFISHGLTWQPLPTMLLTGCLKCGQCS